MRYIILFLSFWLLGMGVLAGEDIETISDISKWQHPVRQVLLKNKVILSKVELRNNKQFPVFFVTLPLAKGNTSTTDYFNHIFLEILKANGYWSYELYESGEDFIILVSWDKDKKQIKVDYKDIK